MCSGLRGFDWDAFRILRVGLWYLPDHSAIVPHVFRIEHFSSGTLSITFRTLPERLVTSETHNEKNLRYTRKNGFSHTIFQHFPAKIPTFPTKISPPRPFHHKLIRSAEQSSTHPPNKRRFF